MDARADRQTDGFMGDRWMDRLLMNESPSYLNKSTAMEFRSILPFFKTFLSHGSHSIFRLDCEESWSYIAIDQIHYQFCPKKKKKKCTFFNEYIVSRTHWLSSVKIQIFLFCRRAATVTKCSINWLQYVRLVAWLQSVTRITRRDVR